MEGPHKVLVIGEPGIGEEQPPERALPLGRTAFPGGFECLLRMHLCITCGFGSYATAGRMGETSLYRLRSPPPPRPLAHHATLLHTMQTLAVGTLSLRPPTTLWCLIRHPLNPAPPTLLSQAKRV